MNSSTTPSSQPFGDWYESEGSLNSPTSVSVLLVLVGFAVAILLCLLLPFLSPQIQRRMRRWFHRSSDNNDGTDISLDANSKRRLRYSTIEAWLVSKRVVPHDKICDEMAMDESHHSHKKRCETGATIDIEEGAPECPICMEAMAVGSIVSWSANPNCTHVFHHECIKEWLLKKSDCPFCRECFLPTDDMPSKLNRKHIQALIVAQRYRSAQCSYCVDHGVVHLNGKQALDEDPTFEELMALRQQQQQEEEEDEPDCEQPSLEDPQTIAETNSDESSVSYDPASSTGGDEEQGLNEDESEINNSDEQTQTEQSGGEQEPMYDY